MPDSFALYVRSLDDCEPLSADEERELCHRMMAGDTAARDRLAASQLRWVVRLARGATRCRLPLEERVAVGNAALLKCLPKFDPDRGRLTTFVAMPVAAAFRNASRRTPDPLDRVTDIDRRGGGVPDRFIGEVDERLDHAARRQAVADALGGLPPGQAAVMRGRLAGRSAVELAREAGVSTAAVVAAERKAVRRLRVLLAAFEA